MGPVPHTRTPAEAWAELLAGNERFVRGEMAHPSQDVDHRAALSGAQNPFAVVFGCSDSRVAAEIVFDRGLGDLFVVRTAGHVVDTTVVGSIEYGVQLLGAPHESWPSTMTSGAPNSCTPYSMDPTTVVSTTCPAVRTTNRSPSPLSKTISAATRESEHPNTTANGFCAPLNAARWSTSWEGCAISPRTKRSLPASSSAQASAGVRVCGTGPILAAAAAEAARPPSAAPASDPEQADDQRHHEHGDELVPQRDRREPGRPALERVVGHHPRAGEAGPEQHARHERVDQERAVVELVGDRDGPREDPCGHQAHQDRHDDRPEPPLGRGRLVDPRGARPVGAERPLGVPERTDDQRRRRGKENLSLIHI